MELSELMNNVEITFEKELSDLNSRVATFRTVTKDTEEFFEYPNAQTLIDLFSMVQSDRKLKLFFLDFMKKQIINSDEASVIGPKFSRVSFLGVSQLCFYTLLKLGFVQEAIDSLIERRQGCEGIYFLFYLLTLNDYFSLVQLKEILAKIRKHSLPSAYASYLDKKIVNSRYEILTTQTKKINIEINQDKKTVSEKILQFDFDKSYIELLDGIDDFINTPTLKIVNAGMISNLRTFMANLFKEVANRIAKQKGEKIPIIKGCAEMGNIRNFLKINLGLSDKDEKFMDSFVDILHSEGGHSFMSEKEYFRLARNIAIEIALFILTKYEKKFKS